MKYRAFAVFVLFVLVLNLGGSTFADSKTKKSNINQLVSMLPASDGVVTFDVKRSFGEALPKLLSGNQPVLATVTDRIDRFQKATGIDIRQFDDAAVGVNARQLAEKKYDIDAVVIARGQMTSSSLIATAKAASNGKHREERVGERLMYVFDAEMPAFHDTVDTKAVGRMAEVAVTVLDEKTLAFGEVPRVRQTLEGKTKVGTDLIGMLAKSPLSVIVSYAVKPPAGIKAFVPLDNDELGRNIDSIQYIYGHADVVTDVANIHAVARTQQNKQAADLYEFIDVLRALGKMAVGVSRKPEKAVYGRMIDNARISVKANEVMLDLSVPQADLHTLVGLMK